MDYQSSGVSLQDQDMFNAKLAAKMPWLGGYSGAYDIGDDYLVSSSDGIGSKIKLYLDHKEYDGVSINNLGIDLVAMVMNDIVCCGAVPLFMNDYLAVHDLADDDMLNLVNGINEGLSQCGANVPLIGGETAIMPDTYDLGDFDVAGFGVGAVKKDEYIDGSAITNGNIILGLKSSGFHSNGYSLIRSVWEEHSSKPRPTGILKKLLTPTKIYVTSVLSVLRKYRESVNGIAHITGGGRDNVLRLLGEDVNLRPVWYGEWDRPEEFKWIQKYGNISDQEMIRVFNDGIGMVMVVDEDRAEDITTLLESIGEEVVEVGAIGSRV